MKDYIIIDTELVAVIIKATSLSQAMSLAREQGIKALYVRQGE